MEAKCIEGSGGFIATIKPNDYGQFAIFVVDGNKVVCWNGDNFPSEAMAERWAEKFLRQLAEDAKATKLDNIETAVPSVEVVADLPDPVEPVTLGEIAAT